MLFVYRISPNNLWSGWMTPDRFQRHLIDDAFNGDINLAVVAWNKFQADLQKAQNLARKIEWDGWVAQGPFVAGIAIVGAPGNIVIAWQQTDNTTFVASPVELPWLDQDCLGKVSG